jgi:transcriptional regulator with XRE-family HTH domain
MTYKELADRLKAIGRPIPTLGLSRIEAGTRRVDADDLVALAVALGVNPSRLLMPDGAGDQVVNITMEVAAPEWAAWQWADGRHPLPTRPGDDLEDPYNTRDELEEFQRLARPADLRRQEAHGTVRTAVGMVASLGRFLRLSPDEIAADAAAANNRANAVRRRLARLSIEVEELLEGHGER